jgi:phosphate transport system protein
VTIIKNLEDYIMRNKFDDELNKLNADILQMGRFIDDTITKTMSAFETNDYSLAKEVSENDYIADELEAKVEKQALRILLSQQPVAKDLRAISTALKMITDMERICDQSQDIAEIVLHFEGVELIKKPAHILQMSNKCVIMVKKSIDAFVAGDLELAKAVILSDDEIDDLFICVRDELIEIISKKPEKGDQALDFLMIAKYLERIGDHAENIAEWVVFNITGEHKDKRIL